MNADRSTEQPPSIRPHPFSRSLQHDTCITLLFLFNTVYNVHDDTTTTLVIRLKSEYDISTYLKKKKKNTRQMIANTIIVRTKRVFFVLFCEKGKKKNYLHCKDNILFFPLEIIWMRYSAKSNQIFTNSFLLYRTILSHWIVNSTDINSLTYFNCNTSNVETYVNS